jgi:MFS family permease
VPHQFISRHRRNRLDPEHVTPETAPASWVPNAAAWAGVAGASPILGLVTSGVLLEAWSWRSVFGLNVVLAVVAIIGTVRFIPESAAPKAPKLDMVGALITVAGLGALVYSIIEAPTAGWVSARTLIGIALGLAILAGFVAWEWAHPSPLLDPRLFRHRAFVISRLDANSSYWLLLCGVLRLYGVLPLGAGMGLAMTPATTAITDALPAAEQGVGSAMNDLSRELGGALGIAVPGSLMQSTYRDHLNVSALPGPLAEHARSSLALAARLGPSVATQAQGAFVDGMHVAQVSAAAVVALAAVAVVMQLRRQ